MNSDSRFCSGVVSGYLEVTTVFFWGGAGRRTFYILAFFWHERSQISMLFLFLLDTILLYSVTMHTRRLGQEVYGAWYGVSVNHVKREKNVYQRNVREIHQK